MRDSRTTSLFVLVALICLLATPFTFAAASSAAGCTPMAVNRITGVVDECVDAALWKRSSAGTRRIRPGQG